MARNELDNAEAWLLDLPPTSRQTSSALAVAAVLVIIFTILAPFGGTPLPQIDAFIPSLETAVFITDLITAILLFAQYSIYQSRALLVLASGYLFTALIVIPHALTFPGAFSPVGLLGAGFQSPAWLYIFWHIGFPTALLIYAWMKNKTHPKHKTKVSASIAIIWSTMIIFCLVCGLTWLSTAGEEFLPSIFQDRTHFSESGHYVAISILIFVIAMFVIAMAMLWAGRRSVLDQWLMVVAIASISETVLASLYTNVRFSLSFYGGRFFSLITSTIVLAVLLTETTRLYSRLASSNMMLQHERINKLMNLDATVASISHEVRQPLAAISAHSQAALRFLKRSPPDLDEVESALSMMISDSHRTSQIFDNIRALFRRTSCVKHEAVNVNSLTLEALRTLDSELKGHDITTRLELTSELPTVMAHKGQLQEVIINLIHNAIEAMEAVKDDRRILRVKTERYRGDAIVISVEDSGPGIDPEKIDSMFDAFVTTKSTGMGLGLAICRMIIERHGGQLSASRADEGGAIFKIILPVASTASA